jgi:hypothetical protein
MPSVKDYLKNRYGYDDRDSADELAMAQEKALADRKANAQYAALEQIGQALSGSKRDLGTDQYLKSQDELANQPVLDLIQRRQQAGNEVKLSGEMESQDPNSQRSNAIRNLAQQLYGKDIDVSGLSAQDADLIFKPQEFLQRRSEVKARSDQAKDELKFKDRQLAQQKKLAKDAIEAKRDLAVAQSDEFQGLPAENKEVIKDLARKNANKISISNQIDAVLANWDALPDDQKLSQGKQLLKVLNSTEGADAIAAEEAKRLGSRLEFALGGLTSGNYGQFGRDLAGFKKQAEETSSGVKRAVELNKKEIERQYGRTPAIIPASMSPEQRRARIQELYKKLGKK